MNHSPPFRRNRTLYLLIFLVFALPLQAEESSGCLVAERPANGDYRMKFDGLTRNYRLYQAEGLDPAKAAPLVLLFHGWGGDEGAFISQPVVRNEADKRGYVLVAPRGLGSGSPDERLNSWSFSGSNTGVDGDGGKICDDIITNDYSYPSCNTSGIARNTCSWTHCQGSEKSDVAFAVALIDEVAEQLCIDTDRVFAVGGSNGGMYAWDLGRNPVSAGRFRAIAPLIGLPHRGYLDGPTAGQEIPAILITGKQDATVPPGAWEDPSPTQTSDGDAFFYTGATAIIHSWSAAFGCPTDSPAASFATSEEIVDCRSYCPTDQGWPPVLDCRAEMGHSYGLEWSWPLIMDFFDAHGEVAN